MGKLRHVTGLVTAAMIGLAGQVHAADGQVPIFVEPEMTPVEYGTGWYLRGDIGLTYHETKRYSRTSTPIPATPVQEVEEIESDNILTFGVGVGYRFSNNLRGEIGYESLASFESNSSATLTTLREPCINTSRRVIITDAVGNTTTTVETVDGAGNPYNISNCIGMDETSYYLESYMANAYYDFDASFLGLRPFVGAGAGLIRNDYSAIIDSTRCVAQGFEACQATDGGNPDFGEEYTQEGTRNTGTSYHLAGSLMLGASYPISENLYFDTTYKWSHMFADPLWGGSDGIDDADIPTDFHTVKFGLRYEIW